MLGTDADKAEENLLQSALSVLGYSVQSMLLRPEDDHKTIKHMRSEYRRIKEKM